MTTFTGRAIDPLDMCEADVHILDIAHALSNICRYGGHSRFFYSVAQHSVYVMEWYVHLYGADPEGMGSALLHDGSEAYLGDIPRPLKMTALFHGYRVFEARVQAAIYRKFHLPEVVPERTHVCDRAVLVAEGMTLMNDLYRANGRPAEIKIEPWTPVEAEARFLDAYRRTLQLQTKWL